MSYIATVLAATSPLLLGFAWQELRYDREYPVVEYATRRPTDSVSRLKESIDRGDVSLAFEEGRGYLSSLLQELGVPVSSQLLVYTKTSFQKGLISPATPRAIYFSDDVYVAWVQGGPAVEISAVDPILGAVFYTLEQRKGAPGAPVLERQTHLCLRCHDSYSLTGGGVPRHIMGSGVPDRSGRLASHEGWYLTTDETPIERRWGGWYVTGKHGELRHLGNLVAGDGAHSAELELAAGANVTDLGALVDTSPYLSPHSDIVALLVIEHQTHVQNLITRVGWDARTWLLEDARNENENENENENSDRLEAIVEPLVRAILFVGEAPLRGPIEGTSGFAEEFVRAGPMDGKGRSLRQLDLRERLFRYPCSYLVHSSSFDALPAAVKQYVYARLRDVLSGADDSPAFAHLPKADRRAVLDILEETAPDFGQTREIARER